MDVALIFYVVVAVTCLVLAIVLPLLLSRDNRLKRRIRAAAPVAIAAARPDTAVRVGGVIEALAESLRAPMTGRACVYYLATLEEHRSNGRSGSWFEIVREERGVDFAVRDASGAVRVHMQGAQVVVVRDHHTRSGTFDDVTAIEAAFLARHGRDATTMLGFNRAYRYTEGALEFGEAVAVLATLQAAADERSLQAGPGGPVLVSDDPSTLTPRA